MARRFFKIYADVLSDERLSSTEKLVLSVITQYAEAGSCYASNNRIAQDVGLSRCSIIRVIKSLKTKRYIKVKMSGKGSNTIRTITPLSYKMLSSEVAHSNKMHSSKSDSSLVTKCDTLSIKSDTQLDKNRLDNEYINPKFPNSKLHADNFWNWKVIREMFPSVPYETYRGFMDDQFNVLGERADPDEAAAFVYEKLVEEENERSSNGEDS